MVSPVVELSLNQAVVAAPFTSAACVGTITVRAHFDVRRDSGDCIGGQVEALQQEEIAGRDGDDADALLHRLLDDVQRLRFWLPAVVGKNCGLQAAVENAPRALRTRAPPVRSGLPTLPPESRRGADRWLKDIVDWLLAVATWLVNIVIRGDGEIGGDGIPACQFGCFLIRRKRRGWPTPPRVMRPRTSVWASAAGRSLLRRGGCVLLVRFFQECAGARLCRPGRIFSVVRS